MAVAIGQAILTGSLQRTSFYWAVQLGVDRASIYDQMQEVFRRWDQEANIITFRGLLALESGEIPQAERFFLQALSLGEGSGDIGRQRRMDFHGRRIAEWWLKVLR